MSALAAANCDVPMLCDDKKLGAPLPQKPLIGDGKSMFDAHRKLRYAPVINWSGKAAADRFSSAVVAAIRAEYGRSAPEPRV